MDLELTGDQKLFRATTRDFLEKDMPLPMVRRVSESDEGFPGQWWQRGAELGWTAMLVPEELGGGSISGSGLRDLVIVAEEMGRLCSPGPLIGTSAALSGLLEGSGDAHAEIIGPTTAGETILSWAVYEPGRGWDPFSSELEVERVGDTFRISGRKDRVEAGDQADILLLTTVTDAGPTPFLVRTNAPGVQIQRSWSLDLTRRYAEVTFSDVEVGPDDLVGAAGDAAPAIERQLQIAAVLQAAETSGVIDRVLEFTAQWAFDRYSFGRPLASYQALKHRFADSRTWLEACHAISDAAAGGVADRTPDAAELASAAKSFVTDKAIRIVQDCVQLHGGIGVTWEHDLHLYLRRATVNRALYGTPEEHRRLIADLMTA